MTLRHAIVSQLLIAAVLGLQQESLGQESRPDFSPFRDLLSSYCADCHTGDDAEAGVNLGAAEEPFALPASDSKWLRVFRAIGAKRMPPEDAGQPDQETRNAAMHSLSKAWQSAAGRRKESANPLHMRRLTNGQFNRSMQKLFDVDCDFIDSLPDDPISSSGYRNDASLLSTSPLRMEYYLEIFRDAVERYVAFDRRRPESFRYEIELKDLYYTTKDRVGTLKHAPQPIAVSLGGRDSELSKPLPMQGAVLAPIPYGEPVWTERLRLSQPKMHQQYIAVPRLSSVGDLIVRVRAAAALGENGGVPRLQVSCGLAYGDGDGIDAVSLGEVDVTTPIRDPQVFEFRVRLEDVPQPKPGEKGTTIYEVPQLFIANVDRDRDAIYELGYGSYHDPDHPQSSANEKQQQVAVKDRKKVADRMDDMRREGVSFLHLDRVEIDVIPTLGRQGEARWQIDLGAIAEDARAQREAFAELLTRFMSEAHRRTPSSSQVAARLELFDRIRPLAGFETAARRTLVSVLASPAFLMIDVGESSKLTSHQLADRLSFTLWMSPPDDELLDSARTGQLARPEVLREQTVRLLDDPRSDLFLKDFTRQWLRLDRFPLVAVDAEKYPEYDTDLADSSLRQVFATVIELIRRGGDARELIDSDRMLVNRRLAEHYSITSRTGAIPSPHGNELAAIRLPEGHQGGGLLTQASLLTMNSNGSDTHPIRRGVWILDRLLNDPPPPPPPNVPELPSVSNDRSRLSLKERIELHRESSNCRGCHERIDPWGIAMEQFDATGRFREAGAEAGSERAAGDPIDASSTLPDGTAVNGIRDLKQHLLAKHSNAFAQSITHHLMTYCLARSPDLADQWQGRELALRFERAGFDLRELMIDVMTSESFRR